MSVLARRTYLAADCRRQQILDCALEVFARRGFHAASVADICARARIARPTLYQYFRDKRDVLVALADRIARRVIDAAERWPRLELVAGALPTREQGLALIEARCAAALEAVFVDRDTARLVLRVSRGSDGLVDATLRQIDDRLLALIEGDLRAALAAGAIRPCDPAVVARFILGGIEKVVLDTLDHDLPLDVGGIARATVSLASLGLFHRDQENT
ncbi:MAG TPA: helix-turn-helix domain-containing protein [Candidatus Binatia bacterium]|nr:helix-turn-helix domain-containing protein [Candidatus Binatia bacterium]